MSTQQPTIIYTLTDEAPLLATRAFLPIIRTFTAPAGINVDTADISVAARILGEFPDYLTPEQRLPNTLADLGKLTLRPEANITKLPNISASVAQLKAAIKELRGKATRSPIFRRRRRPTKRRKSAPATTVARAARSTRCCAKAIQTVARPGR